MIELFDKWFNRFGEIAIIDHPPHFRVNWSFDFHFEIPGVPMSASTFVSFGNLGKMVSRVEFKPLRNPHGRKDSSFRIGMF